MSAGRLFAVRGNDDDFGIWEGFGDLGERFDAFGVNSVVVGNQDAHGWIMTMERPNRMGR